MRISDWSSDVCSSDLEGLRRGAGEEQRKHGGAQGVANGKGLRHGITLRSLLGVVARRSGRVGKTSRNIFHARYSGLTKASATARLAPVCAGLFISGTPAAGARLPFADARLRIGVGQIGG